MNQFGARRQLFGNAGPSSCPPGRRSRSPAFRGPPPQDAQCIPPQGIQCPPPQQRAPQAWTVGGFPPPPEWHPGKIKNPPVIGGLTCPDYEYNTANPNLGWRSKSRKPPVEECIRTPTHRRYPSQFPKVMRTPPKGDPREAMAAWEGYAPRMVQTQPQPERRNYVRLASSPDRGMQSVQNMTPRRSQIPVRSPVKMESDTEESGFDYEERCGPDPSEDSVDDCTDFEEQAQPADEECDPCPMPDNYECPLPVECQPVPCTLGRGEPDDTKTDISDYQMKMCGEAIIKLNQIIKALTPFTTLDEFMISVAELTPDKGETMFDVMSNEVSHFKELIREIYASRNDSVSELLKAEQKHLKKKYEKWTADLTRRMNDALQRLMVLVEGFDMAAYNSDPKQYVYKLMSQNAKKKKNDESVNALQLSDSPEKALRIGMHKRTWLVREAERMECENEERMVKLNEMLAQLACLSENLANSNKKLAAYNRQLEAHATCLRNKMTKNDKVLNCLLDEVELNKMDRDSGVCPVIQPDDILTPFPSGVDYC